MYVCCKVLWLASLVSQAVAQPQVAKSGLMSQVSTAHMVRYSGAVTSNENTISPPNTEKGIIPGLPTVLQLLMYSRFCLDCPFPVKMLLQMHLQSHWRTSQPADPPSETVCCGPKGKCSSSPRKHGGQTGLLGVTCTLACWLHHILFDNQKLHLHILSLYKTGVIKWSFLYYIVRMYVHACFKSIITPAKNNILGFIATIFISVHCT